MKKLLKSSLIIGSALLFMAGCSGDASNSNDSDAFTFELGHGGSIDSHLNEGAKKFIELVDEKSDGRIVINNHPNSQLGAEREMTESVQSQLLDIAIVSTGPVGNFADKVNALDFPFLFDDHKHAEDVLDGPVGEEINAQLESVNLKNLYWVDNGSYHLVSNNKPIRTVEDMKGLKFRTQENQVQIDTTNALGASATPIAFSELFLSAQQGVIDGQGNSLAVLIPNSYYDVHKYLTITNHMYSAGMILMNNQSFTSLPEDVQQILLEAAKEAGTHQRQFVQELNAEYLETAKANGMEIIEDADLEPFKAAVQPVYEKHASNFGELHDKIREAQ
ncbi:TRAP transporter substrate-binding protein [Bacillus sp. B15-48]|uniref:TRAP transporter substrate-binding protein n=1 Tax=Bacillus sp. B15-48 TaxID=1548601 RepID=UPI00193FE051|nr:TRAP transporter substrate-binding protein [Bacillus sp. B15-48]MBM4761376.1 DctP family TRAP transporter solute-binding subunit [Bacillus sp. B15-48]